MNILRNKNLRSAEYITQLTGTPVLYLNYLVILSSSLSFQSSIPGGFTCFCKLPEIFASLYMMHVKIYMPEDYTTTGNFNKFFLCNLQNLDATENFQF